VPSSAGTGPTKWLTSPTARGDSFAILVSGPALDQGESPGSFHRFDIGPLQTDTFRLVIRASANPQYPNAAQVGEIELLPGAK
jgi:hypothetical protein